VELTQDYLKSLLHYNPETGEWKWLIRKAVCVSEKKQAGGICDVYGIKRRKIGIDHKVYTAARLAFLYMLGRWPMGVVDHFDGNGLNDKWENLREVSQHDNMKNVLTHRDLPMGVYQWKNGKYYSRIMLDGKSECLGTFETMEEARDIYISRRHELMGKYPRI